MAVSRSNILMPTIETAGDRGVRNIFLLRSNTVSAGTRDGQILRLRGEGELGLGGGKPGDALVEIDSQATPLFHAGRR